jgi:hypothetical protein
VPYFSIPLNKKVATLYLKWKHSSHFENSYAVPEVGMAEWQKEFKIKFCACLPSIVFM